jgi:tRNA nucleotidyltransferase (CCA-adding enzyme)
MEGGSAAAAASGGGSPPPPAAAAAVAPPPARASRAFSWAAERVAVPTTVVYESSQTMDVVADPASGPGGGPSDVGDGDKQTCEIRLDRQEEELFALLIGAAEAYESGAVRLPRLAPGVGAERLEIRVAGGWVRDKLLRLQTHDVDVAVNCLTGHQMAELVRLYVQGHPEHHLQCGRIGVIAANPAQSKHLETATMPVCGLEVDFCNLRAEEVYRAESRIPVVEFGSPRADAERRDFTVNALFYNIRSGQVEDWTERGLADLRAGLLVTPLDPLRTFRDDPLRVLRAVRFAVRYRFRLDPAIEAAAMNQEIHKKLHIKISRERIGKELEGMLSGKGARPVSALEMIARLKLAGSVFCVPTTPPPSTNGNPSSPPSSSSIYSEEAGVAAIKVEGKVVGHEYRGHHDSEEARHVRELGWEEARVLLQLFLPVLHAHEQQQQRTTGGKQPVSTVNNRLLPVAVFLLPFRDLVYTENPKKHNPGNNSVAREFLVVSYMFREGIKFKNKDVRDITTLMKGIDRMTALLEEASRHISLYGVNDANEPVVCRLEAGMLLRDCTHLWVSLLLLATVVKLREQQQRQQQQTWNGPPVDWIRICGAVYRSIVELDLDECWKSKPLLNGREVIEALGLPRGPAVGTYIDEQVKWMFLNPTGTAEECKAHLLKVKRGIEAEQSEQNERLLGMSDGTGKTHSSPVHCPKNVVDGGHFSKKMHVDRMDI